ncbi:hypothetical protein [Ideonella sp.]|jgi:hypothetical protein|uniref:hypothetical protein n=1 Tax=Ideonella sp. TaxID=1929293 RepID=UPI0037C15019
MTSSSAHFSVALLAFDNMEALDFAGPFEVFTTASRVARKCFSFPVPMAGSGTDPKDLFSVCCVARMAESLGWDGAALAEATAHQMDYVWTQA